MANRSQDNANHEANRKRLTEQERKELAFSFCKLLEKYPLYDFRTTAGRKLSLHVLLIGGRLLEPLRDMILSQGQLLDTALEVTVVTGDPQGAAEQLRENAPELERFLRIRLGETKNEPEWDLGTLCFVAYPTDKKEIKKLLAKYSRCRYVLIDGDHTEVLGKNTASGTRRLIAAVEGTQIRICGSDEVFTPNAGDAYLEGIMDVAYRLHYAYEKGNDPHITNREIRKNFEDPYNNISNIECAIHIRSKLKCAGIDPTAVKSAAEEFAKKLEEDARDDGDLLERLARLEHQRWCISKLLGGFRRPKSLDVVYGSPGDTSHSVERGWHIALVPYGRADKKLCRRLTEQDWTVEDPDAIADLDELDKQTLRVHSHCGKLAQERLNVCIGYAEEMENLLPEEDREYARQMKEALKAMQKGERDAVNLYRYHRRSLEIQPSAVNQERVKALLEQMKERMGAPIEYLTRKDYKQQNLVLVGNIPFALCSWKSTVLVKLMAEDIRECFSAVWQLEPGEVVFVDTAETLDELRDMSRKAKLIDRFISRHCDRVKASYHIFVPKGKVYFTDVREGTKVALFLEDIRQHDPDLFGNCDWQVYARDTLDAEEIRPRFVELLQEVKTTSIDLTGGKPVLISLADGYARNNRVGAFFIRDQRICNFYGARSMALQALDKGLTVQQLFEQMGAERIKQDDDEITGVFYGQCTELWKIAHRYAKHWHHFCMCFARAYRDKPVSTDPEELLCVPDEKIEEKRGDRDLARHEPSFQVILDALHGAGLLIHETDKERRRAAGEEVLACLRNSGKVLEYYIYGVAKHSGLFKDVALSWLFRHDADSNAAKNEVDVVCTTKDDTAFFISAKNVSEDSVGKNNFLNYVCYEVGWLADRFGGLRPKTILAAPNVSQFEGKKRSGMVEKAMSRGVYLLGDRCFEEDNLRRVLENIVNGEEKWCEFLLK